MQISYARISICGHRTETPERAHRGPCVVDAIDSTEQRLRLPGEATVWELAFAQPIDQRVLVLGGAAEDIESLQTPPRGRHVSVAAVRGGCVVETAVRATAFREVIGEVRGKLFPWKFAEGDDAGGGE